MPIDWFTVGAQALNFVILAWLMKRFLYKPILDAIDGRERRIADKLASAGNQLAEAQREHDDYAKKNGELEQQRSALLAKSRVDSDIERQKSMDAARQAADAWIAQRRASFATEAQALVRGVRLRTQAEVFALAGQALADLAGISLEARFCEVFIDRLKALEDPQRQALLTALKDEGNSARVRSAFELPADQRLALQHAIQVLCGAHLELQFERDPALVGGMELSAQGQKFAWSISDYLASVERAVSMILKVPVPAPATKPVAGNELPTPPAPGVTDAPSRSVERVAEPAADAAPVIP